MFALILFWKSITDPVPGASKKLHVFGSQPDFFVKLAIHCLLRGFTTAYAPLGELPAAPPGATAQEHHALVVEQNYADIGSVTIGIDTISHRSVANLKLP